MLYTQIYILILKNYVDNKLNTKVNAIINLPIYLSCQCTVESLRSYDDSDSHNLLLCRYHDPAAQRQQGRSRSFVLLSPGLPESHNNCPFTTSSGQRQKYYFSRYQFLAPIPNTKHAIQLAPILIATTSARHKVLQGRSCYYLPYSLTTIALSLPLSSKLEVSS